MQIWTNVGLKCVLFIDTARDRRFINYRPVVVKQLCLFLNRSPGENTIYILFFRYAFQHVNFYMYFSIERKTHTVGFE